MALHKWKIVLVLVLFGYGFLGAQETFKYQGSFQNGLPHPAEASYSYYIDESTHSKMLDGSFKYRVRISNDLYRFYQDIKGKYSSNLKIGTWQYKTSFKDYNPEMGRDYLSGNMTLSARYSKGVPNGDWNYSYTYKTRDKLDILNGRIKWSSYSPTYVQQLKFTMNEGMITDSIFIRNGNKWSVKGQFNKNGMLDGTWYIDTKETDTILSYDNGILKEKKIILENGEEEKTVYTLSPETMQKIELISNNNQPDNTLLKNLKYTIDTMQLVKNRSHYISTAINDYIFRNKYFLFNYIDGDKMGFKELRGTYILELGNKASQNELVKLDSIKKIHDDFTRMNIDINNLSKTKRFSPQQESLIKIVKYYSKIAQRYECMSESLLTYMDIEKGKARAEENCSNIVQVIEGIPEFSDREEALDLFMKELREKRELCRTYMSVISR